MDVSMKLTSQIPNHYEIEVLTQSEEKTIYICQDSNGIRFSIRSFGNLEKHIPRDIVEGLPKGTFVPKEFFEKCHATLSQHTVKLNGRIKGGMWCYPSKQSKQEESETKKESSKKSFDAKANLSVREVVEVEDDISKNKATETSVVPRIDDDQIVVLPIQTKPKRLQNKNTHIEISTLPRY